MKQIICCILVCIGVIVNAQRPTLTITISGYTANLGCNPSASQINNAFGTASAVSSCPGAVTISITNGPVNILDCNRSQTRTWTARDMCRNVVTTSRTVNWKEDITPPFIVSPPDKQFACNPTESQINSALGNVGASDACGTATVVFTENIISSGCSRSLKRTWIATDGCSNTSTTSTSVSWTEDLIAPVISIPGLVPILGCNPSKTSIGEALGQATVTDNCGAPAVTVSDGDVVSNGCNRSQTRTWTAVDLCGNQTTASRTVNWTVDLSNPFIITPPNVLIGCNPSAAAINVAFGNATATDDCGVTITFANDPVIISGCNRSQKRKWTASDGCGNITTSSTTVSWTEDLIAPVITISGSVPNLGCNPSGESIEQAFGQINVTDNCGTVNVIESGSGTASDGCNRSRTKTWTATDNCNNVSTVSTTVTWTVDHSNPIINVPPNALLGCNPSAADINAAFGNATATDNCGVTIIFANDPVISSGCNRSQQRNWTAIDGCGNISTASNTVSWTESTLTISITGDNPNRGCNPTSPPELGFGTATANGSCSTPVLTISDGPVISNGCNRSKTRTWTATDNCNNTVTALRTVTWTVDQTPPVFTGNYLTVNLGVTPSQLQINQALNGATATDACSAPAITSIDSDVPTNDPCLLSRKRVFTARDACGNQATISRTVTWIPCVTNPLINVMDVTVSENAGFAKVNVFLSAPGSSVVTVKYKTNNGTARTPGDYTSTTGTLSFAAGTGIRFFDVPIIADNITEGDENFFITLSNPQNGTINDGNGMVTITESQLLTKSNANVSQVEQQQAALTVPNPQRRSETLKFYGIDPGSFDVSIIDMRGRVVAYLKNYMNTWKLSLLSSGIYLYRLEYKSEKGRVIKTGRLLITD